MSDLKKILEDNGKEAVQLYRQSLRDNDRVATGDTNQSIRYEVKETNKTTTTLTLYALDHIRFLETGMSPAEFQSSKDAGIFQQITRWANARGINRTANSIIRSLELNGYEGTPDLITSVDESIENNILNDIKQSSKSIILGELRTSKNGNISN